MVVTMVRPGFPFGPGLVGLALLLAACAPGPAPHGPDLPPGPLQRLSDNLPRPAMTHTLASGYEAIVEKFIREVTVAEVAVDGLNGLGSLDPALVVSRDGDSVDLWTTDRRLARLAAPPDDDVGGWARLTVDAVAAARDGSPAIAEADSETLYEALFDSALSQLDVHSRYAGAEEAREHRSRREGFGGIGIRFRRSGPLVRIIGVMPNSPADLAGLRVGDLILDIDGQGTAMLDRHDVVERLRGPINSRLSLRVRPETGGPPRTVAMVRRRIVPPTVFGGRTVDGIAVLRITGFNQDTADSLAERVAHLRRLMGPGLRGLVLDLRGNPGGLLRQSVSVADLFLDSGAIVHTRGRHPESLQAYFAEQGDMLRGLPLVVLIDGRSASAAEIVAAALQDQGRAAVVGTVSYGKGTVQTLIRLPNDGEITLTWSRFQAPSGYLLERLGVRPAICTSGDTAAPDDLGLRVEDGARALAEWRRLTLRALQDRARARHQCRPERHRGETDPEVARRLIADSRLYGRAVRAETAAALAERDPEDEP